MGPARRLAALVVIAAAVIALAVFVAARNSSPDDELLALAVGLAGLGLLVSILPDA